MKKVVSLILAALMLLTLSVSFAEDGAVSTGMAIITALSGNDATAEKNGLAQADIACAAVLVDANGVVVACQIDTTQGKINFDATGAIVTPLDTKFASKKVLKEGYGMKVASPIGKEWYEQIPALEALCVGKTRDEIAGIALTEAGKPADADVAASVSIKISELIKVVIKAIDNAQVLGAQAGDDLYLTCYTVCSSSKAATAEKDGNAQSYGSVGAFTVKDGVITSAIIDEVQANFSFNAAGQVTQDLAFVTPTKIEKQEAYGMRPASAIGKEWFEQAAFFCQYITGKTVAEVVAIPVNDSFKTTDADLATGCTVSLDAFTALVAQIAE